jgi:hypothetical protein
MKKMTISAAPDLNVDMKLLNLCRKERSTRGETNLARKAFRPPKQEETQKILYEEGKMMVLPELLRFRVVNRP